MRVMSSSRNIHVPRLGQIAIGTCVCVWESLIGAAKANEVLTGYLRITTRIITTSQLLLFFLMFSFGPAR
ncbi:hypothetical protein GGI42DRAFT_329134 [Trichoderma sp. SZMC 28013]